MNTTKNIQTVQQIYADFGAGNVSGIMNSISDDVVWVDAGYPDLPYGSTGRSKKDIPAFFKSLNESVDYKKFEPKEFIADGNSVIVLGYHEGNTKPANKSFGQEWVMVWKLDDSGKVKYYRSFLDTNELVKAYKN